MSGLDEHVIQWWDRLNDDKRSRVNQVAATFRGRRCAPWLFS